MEFIKFQFNEKEEKEPPMIGTKKRALEISQFM